MKRTALTLILSFVAVLAMADSITPEKARTMASSFFTDTRSQARVSLVWDGTDGLTRSASTPAFYVFNREGGGFVIISGDDAAVPVLGFSETGSFQTEGMPENIRHWFDEYTAQINYLRNIGEKQRATGAALWDKAFRVGIRGYSPVKRVETPSWGQGAPFNNLCPNVDGGRSVTGCVSTAVCEVMYIHQWPLTTKGEKLDDYTYTTDKKSKMTITGHNLSTSYNWGSIKRSYKGSYSETEATAVATLMHDVGVMLQSEYNPTGTGAYAEMIPTMLIHYMDYDSSAYLAYREEFTNREWCDLIKKDIDAGLPVVYGGDGEGGGHEFVLDGYATEDFFYVNWGWSGSDNAYYKISSLMVDKDYDFRFHCSAVFSLKKNAGGKPEERILYYLNNSYKGGLTLTSGSFEKGKTANVSLNNLCNYGEGTFVGQIALCVVDWKGKVKQVYEAQDLELESQYGINASFSVAITETPAFGDKLMVCYKGRDDWKPVLRDPYYYNYMVDAIPAYDYPAIQFDPTISYKAGDVFDLQLVNNLKPANPLTWYYDSEKLPGDISSITLTSGQHTIRAVAKINSVTHNIYQVINVQ